MAVAAVVALVLSCASGCSARPTGRTASLDAETDGGEGDAAQDAAAPSDGADGRDAGAAEAPDAALPWKHYRAVLHAGDSTVGGNGGLTRALGLKFRADGARFYTDSWTSTSVGRFAHQEHLGPLLRRTRPDLVILNLGTNDVFVPHPEALAGAVASIARAVGKRDCYWVGPPLWKPDTGIVDVIRKACAPCRFVDASHLDVERSRDGVHPTNEGGAAWADQVWAAMHADAFPARSR